MTTPGKITADQGCWVVRCSGPRGRRLRARRGMSKAQARDGLRFVGWHEIDGRWWCGCQVVEAERAEKAEVRT